MITDDMEVQLTDLYDLKKKEFEDKIEGLSLPLLVEFLDQLEAELTELIRLLETDQITEGEFNFERCRAEDVEYRLNEEIRNRLESDLERQTTLF